MTKTENTPPPAAPDCFVIMPIADREGYPVGHFGMVYEQIIAPAIVDAGYTPRLASNSKSAVIIPLEIISQLLNAPIAICDISDLNPNVMFELGFRQAFDMPVVIMKDERTKDPFDINSIRYLEYYSDRRYETVVKARKELTEMIKDTLSGSSHSVNSLVRLLGVTAAAQTKSDQDPTAARLELVERSLSNLSNSIENLTRKASPSGPPVILHNVGGPNSGLRGPIGQLDPNLIVRAQDLMVGSLRIDGGDISTVPRASGQPAKKSDK
ncbi:hypothetical protein [Methylobacterium sp. J-092]|uniref:hypothetical protein n=1 Tax=Methylobacterium sp. J-092 TaxID=2836667 RepID=UPI001FB8F385|nr:hypothetical protein [Methylobacterium sp. J-092]MCJ2009104.1 hypothetical protein [Methylobacterium sp. J-092]